MIQNFHLKSLIKHQMLHAQCLQKNASVNISEDVTFSSAAINGEIEEVDEQDGSIIVGAEETDPQQRDIISSNKFPEIESEFQEYQALRNQNHDSKTEVRNNPAKFTHFYVLLKVCGYVVCSLPNKLQLQNVEAGRTCPP